MAVKELIVGGVRRNLERLQPVLTGDSVETQRFLGLWALYGTILQVGPGQYRAYVDIGHRNGSLQDINQQIVDFRNYSSAVNSIAFPFQFLTSTLPMDVEQYIRDLIKEQVAPISEEKLNLIKNHIAFMRQKSQEQLLLERKTVAVIPYDLPMVRRAISGDEAEFDFIGVVPDEVQTELRDRVSRIVRAFAGPSTPAHQMSPRETAKYLYRMYNPTTSLKEPLREDTDFLTPADLVGEIAPANLKPYRNRLFIDDTHQCAVQVTGYPRELANWVKNVTASGRIVTVSESIAQMSKQEVQRSLRTRAIGHGLQRARDTGRVVENTTVKAAHVDVNIARDEAERREKQMFRFRVSVKVSGRTKDEMLDARRDIESTLSESGLTYAKPLVDPGTMIRHSFPTAMDTDIIQKVVNTDIVAMSHPLDASGPSADPGGALWGVALNFKDIGKTQQGAGQTAEVKPNQVVSINPARRLSSHKLIIGQIRMGKDLHNKLAEERENEIHSTKLVSIDPEEGREMRALIRRLGGPYYTLSSGGRFAINSYDPPPKALLDPDKPDILAELISEQLDLLTIMLNQGQLFENRQLNVLEDAIKLAYKASGITEKTIESYDPSKGDITTMETLYKVLRRKRGTPLAQDLAGNLETFITGPNSFFFTQPTNVHLPEHDAIGFSVSGLSKHIRPSAYQILTRHIWKEVRRNVEEYYQKVSTGEIHSDEAHKIQYRISVGEGWDILNKPGGPEFMETVVRKGGHYDTYLTIITQRLVDLLSSEVGETIVALSRMKYILHLEPNELEVAARALNLPSRAVEAIRRATEGEALFIDGESMWLMRMLASDEEYRAITTKLADQHIFASMSNFSASEVNGVNGSYHGLHMPSGVVKDLYPVFGLN